MMIPLLSSDTLRYYLAEHSTIINFRWSPTETWGSTWSFLVTSISIYILTTSLLHLLLLFIFPSRRPLPLGPLPSLHSLTMTLLSATIFLGTLLSTAAEIRDTRWSWRRSKTTPFQWLLCFPLGTRPSGRVFFWSYAYYLSRFIHAGRSYIAILKHRKLSFFKVFNHSILIFMSFLWLEFSQSFQVLAILCTTLVYTGVYGYRFWGGGGMRDRGGGVVNYCQMVLLGCNLVCHFGVLGMHLIKGGCNGIGAWVFNSVLNGAILFLVLNFYVRRLLKKRNNNSSSHRKKDDDQGVVVVVKDKEI